VTSSTSGSLVHEQRLYLVKAVSLGDSVAVVFDSLRGVLVAVGTVADDREAKALPDVRILGRGFGPLDDHVRHRIVRADRPAVVDRLADVLGLERGLRCAGAVRLPPVGIPLLEAKFPRDDLFREVAFTDKERDDEHLVGLEGADHLAEVGFFLPERLADLVERARLADRIRVGVGRVRGVRIQMRSVCRDDQRFAWPALSMETV